jgi:hydrogenase/urease accessory protein HupE
MILHTSGLGAEFSHSPPMLRHEALRVEVRQALAGKKQGNFLRAFAVAFEFIMAAKENSGKGAEAFMSARSLVDGWWPSLLRLLALKWFAYAFSGAGLLLLALPAYAHPVPFSYLDLHIYPGEIRATLVAHISDVAHDLNIDPVDRLLSETVVAKQAESIRSLLAARLQVAADGSPLNAEWSAPEIRLERQSLCINLRYSTAVSPGMVAVNAMLFPYDPNHQTFVNIYEGAVLKSQVILDRAHPRLEYFTGTRQGTLAVILKFLPEGIRHIMIGPDHLLFLVGLLLLGGSIRKLLLVVTSFTLAHSITLSLATLSIFSPPARLIEPAIALSIVYVGADNILSQGGRDVRAWIAFAFGFIHGFGFANVLREMDLPRQALGWSLFSFNFGVEIGQLLVVAAIATGLVAVRSRSEWAGRRIAFAGSIFVIVAGTFWFIQRVFFPGAIS